MNLPNRLTVARFFLTLLFVVALEIPWAYAHTAGLFFFVLASLTDYADGEIARRYQLETNFGRLMDPLADKVLIAAAFICLVSEHAMPAWVAILVISREFMITGLRVLAANKGIVLSADKAGKHKAVWQIIVVLYLLLLNVITELFGVTTGQGWLWRGPAWVLLAVAMGLTVYSGAEYVWKNRTLLQET